MRILFLNCYHSGSHAATAEGYAARSRHTVTLLTLPPTGGWRWRMRGGAVTLARLSREQAATPATMPDLLFATDMLDLATYRALTSDLYRPHIPAVVYVFENQLTYPLPAGRPRDLSYGWTNYTTMLVASRVYFNSAFHRRWFFDALPDLLGRYHDYNELQTIDEIEAKTQVLPTGIDLARLAWPAPPEPPPPTPSDPPIILWSSRWDYDKQPQVFFDALESLSARGVDFRLIVAGEAIDPNTPAFVAARERWSAHIVHWGYPADTPTYRHLLHQADIVVSTAIQETLGIGILEALFCGCIPILPRRLVYPDLIPSRYHAECLYDTFDELVDRLQHAVARRDTLCQYDWPALAAPYDWSRLAPQYDTLLDELVEQYHERHQEHRSPRSR
jgi:glycosyltransferase involved in cell wall biosynthesis